MKIVRLANKHAEVAQTANNVQIVKILTIQLDITKDVLVIKSFKLKILEL